MTTLLPGKRKTLAILEEKTVSTMKRTWVVTVQEGIGHEYHDTISNAEFYGPFTQAQAEKLADDLNDLFRHVDPHEERKTADAMPLSARTVREVRAIYQDMIN